MSKKTTQTTEEALGASEEKLMPFVACRDLTEEEQLRFVQTKDVKQEIEGVMTLVQEPVFLEDTGKPEDLKKAIQLTALYLGKKIVKGTATPEEMERYTALNSNDVSGL